MSKIKDDLLREIERNVQRKKELSKEVAREKTIARWVSDFFIELDKVSKVDSDGTFTSLALAKLTMSLRSLDRKCSIILKEPRDVDMSQIEIHWSNVYIMKNNCEPVMVMDSSTAHFQSAMEDAGF